jgi:hypothetical protein
MYYQEMRDLFARVAQSSGRYSVVLATRVPETIAREPEIAANLAAAGGSWLVALWDHTAGTGVVVVHPDDLAGYEQALAEVAPDERAAWLEEARAQMGERPVESGMRWAEVLQLLRELQRLAPRWSVTDIACVGCDPRAGYAVTLCSQKTTQHLVFTSAAAVRAACCRGGPLAA